MTSEILTSLSDAEKMTKKRKIFAIKRGKDKITQAKKESSDGSEASQSGSFVLLDCIEAEI